MLSLRTTASFFFRQYQTENASSAFRREEPAHHQSDTSGYSAEASRRLPERLRLEKERRERLDRARAAEIAAERGP